MATTTRVLGIPNGPDNSYDADLPPGPTTIIFNGDWYPLNVPATGGPYHFLELIPDYASLALAKNMGVVTTAQGQAMYGRTPLRDLFRPIGGTLPSGVLTSDSVTTSSPTDYTNQWGTVWNSGQFNTQGQNLIPVVPGTPAAGCINDNNGRFQVVNGTTVPFGSIIDIEFLFTGTKLDVMMQTFGYFDCQVYVEYEGQMMRAQEYPLTGNNSGYSFRSMRFAEACTRRIRVVMPAVYFIQIIHEQSDVIAPSPNRPLIITTGDSYFESSTGYNAGSTRTYATWSMQDQIAELTGFAIARCGQGGTGYFNDGTGNAGSLTATAGTTNTSPFGSQARIAKYGQYLGNSSGAVAFLINGTINDGGLSGDGTNANQANMTARATALYNSISALDSQVGIVAIGPEPINGSYASGAHAVNRLGIMAALQSCPQGIGFVDANNPTTPFWTGTGSMGSPNTSQQAALVGNDGIHPDYYGHSYYGHQITAALGSMLVSRARVEGLS